MTTVIADSASNGALATSTALRVAMLACGGLTGAVLAAGLAASVATADWTHFPRAGAVVVLLGIVLTSRKVLIARNDLLNLLNEMAEADGTTRTARLRAFKQLQRDLDRQLLERAGLAQLVLGTLVWAFGDLLGRL